MTTKPSANPDAVTGQGEFHASKPRSSPMTTKGHAIGTQVGNDTIPTFQAQTLPPGTAPPDSTFTPDTTTETPRQTSIKGNYVSASDSLTGATSADVHKGYGHPGQGQVKSDEKTETGGLVGRGASGVESGRGMVDERKMAGQSGKDTETLGAEEREPVRAEDVAAERE